MKPDRGTLFLTFTGLLSIVLIVALAAAVVTGPPQPAPELLSSDSNQSPLLGDTANLPERAQPALKTANYPGISRSYTCEKMFSDIDLHLDGPIYSEGTGDVTDLVLNDDGTVTVTVKNLRVAYFTLGGGGIVILIIL